MAAPTEPLRFKKPMYEDEHANCSVLLAKIRNEDALLCLPPHEQFRWLHRFYLVLDRVVEQHRVYKLYGGPHGFMASTGVAEPDPEHAATLLRFALHLTQAVQSIRLAGSTPLDLVLVLASGPASSGLLGTTSLTYQIVGKVVSVAREIMETQTQAPFIVTGGMLRELKPSVVAELAPLGSVPLRCCPGEHEALYSLPRYAAAAAAQPQPHAPLPGQDEQQQGQVAGGGSGATAARRGEPGPASRSPAVPASAAGTVTPAASPRFAQPPAALDQAPWPSRSHAAKPWPPFSEDSLPYNQASSEPGPPADLLLRFEDPQLEGLFVRYNGEAQRPVELAWLVLGLLSAALYALAWRGTGLALPIGPLALFQALPLAGAALGHFRRDSYLRLREVLWFVQRLLILAFTSLPASPVFAQPATAPLLAFGLTHLALEALMRRLRLHLQLLSSLVVYGATLTLMPLHPPGSLGHTLVTPTFLGLHLLLTVVFPVMLAAASDNLARLAFRSRLAAAAVSAPSAKPKLA